MARPPVSLAPPLTHRAVLVVEVSFACSVATLVFVVTLEALPEALPHLALLVSLGSLAFAVLVWAYPEVDLALVENPDPRASLLAVFEVLAIWVSLVAVLNPEASHPLAWADRLIAHLGCPLVVLVSLACPDSSLVSPDCPQVHLALVVHCSVVSLAGFASLVLLVVIDPLHLASQF